MRILQQISHPRDVIKINDFNVIAIIVKENILATIIYVENDVSLVLNFPLQQNVLTQSFHNFIRHN